MLVVIFTRVARCYYFLARFAPGPWLISRIRRRDGLKWGVPAMLVALPYFSLADVCKRLIENGGDAWLALPLLWCLIMGMAFAALGPISLLKLIGARISEAKRARGARLERDRGETAPQHPQTKVSALRRESLVHAGE